MILLKKIFIKDLKNIYKSLKKRIKSYGNSQLNTSNPLKARGPKKHLKRIAAPKSWMLGKIGGNWATRPSQGPHKLRESIPLAYVLRTRLKYALNGREVTLILQDKEGTVKVDQRTRRDGGFPCGMMDVVSVEKSGENFRVLYDVKGRFVLRKVKEDEAKFKLCRIKRKEVGANKVPYVVTHDGRTLRYPNPEIDVNDTIKLNLLDNTVMDHVKFDIGNVAYVIAGNNVGRIGMITARDSHPGSFDIVHIKDARGKSFATRLSNVFVIGKGKKAWISVPKDNGLYLNSLEQKQENLRRASN